MLDNILEQLKAFFRSRLLPVAGVYLILFGILVNRIFSLQIIEGVTITEEGERKQERILEIKSTRGRIYDCNGVLLADNALSYNVTYEDTGALKDNEQKNAMIYKMIQIIEDKGSEISTENYFRIDKNGQIQYTLKDENALLQFKKEVFSTSVDKLTTEQKEMDAQTLFDFIRYDTSVNGPDFEISEDYSLEDAMKIMSVRFAIFLNRYSKYEKLTIATNISDVAVAAIKENASELPGVDISQDTTRVYNDSEYFAHILGYTGAVTTEKLAELETEAEEKGEKTTYNLTDQIGITGIESAFEDYLKGTKGSETVMINENYRVVDVKETKDPVAGNDIYLTIDAKLQKACYDILEKDIAGILISKITDGMDAGTRGKSARDIKVPIYDVYNAILTNNVLNIDKFSSKKASSLEKATYKKYKNKCKKVLEEIRGKMAVDSKESASDLPEEMEEYLDYAYTLLRENDIILSGEIDRKDSKYVSFADGKLSLSQFLQHAISNNWINLDKLKIGSEYLSTEEIYEILLDYTIEHLSDDAAFTKMIYSYLVYNHDLSGTEICLLLYDQGVLKYDEKEIAKLENGTVSPYDFIIQKIKKLEITPGQLALDPCSGSIVVTDVNTGEIKAMVTYPSYDNNKMANKVDSDYYYSYIDGNQAFPAMNRPTQQKTAPGSTFKMVTAATALEEGIINTATTIHDNVTFDEIFPSPKCWSSTSHGNLTVAHAIEVSCNYFFYELGYRLSDGVKDNINNKKGLASLKKYAKKFGLLDTSGVEISEESPQFSDTDAIRSAIGQGTHNYTPVQLSRYVTTIANEGTCYDLTLIDKIDDMNGNTVLNNKAKAHNKVRLDASTWSAIHQGMYWVVNGKDSSIDKLFEKLKTKVAGKTGTAQENDEKANHALFVSYAPYDNPEISVTAVIPNGHTSSNAAEVARDVYKYYFGKSKKIKSNVTTPELNTAAFSD